MSDPRYSYRAVVEDVLNQVAELLGEYSDVVDGDEGHPRPNKAMSLLNEVEIVLARLDRLDGPKETEAPLCDGCAQAWFTERNHLKGDHGCIVCAFLGNRRISATGGEGS